MISGENSYAGIVPATVDFKIERVSDVHTVPDGGGEWSLYKLASIFLDYESMVW